MSRKRKDKQEICGYLPVKPLSINKCFLGRKRKSGDYRKYEQLLFNSIDITRTVWDRGRLQIHFVFGVSSSQADVDNPVKPLQDILQKVYHFNDKRVYRIIADKILVKRGEEFIQWAITPLPVEAEGSE